MKQSVISMKYKYLFFDLDNTLLDFTKSSIHAFKVALKVFNKQYSKKIFDQYELINNELWKKYENKEIQKEYIFATRFCILFKQLNWNINGNVFQKLYQDILSIEVDYIPYSMFLVKKLHKNYKIYIVSNGLISTQEKRINNSMIKNYLDGVFLSERAGCAKPDVSFFDYCLKFNSDFSKDNILIIGDSLSSDIMWGNNLGIDTVWFNPKSVLLTVDIHPTYIVKDLRDLYKII
jgi:2-haloacid dehalogenase